MSAPAIVHGGREQWLLARRERLTASDIPAVLGQDPRRSPFQVWADKVHGLEAEEVEIMVRGREFEAPIGRAYHRQTKRPVVAAANPFELTQHPDVPWLAATLDARTIGCVETPDPFGQVNSLPLDCSGPEPKLGDVAPLQIKMATGSGAAWKDDAPLHYQIQLQAEIACAGAKWGSLTALVGPGPLAVFDYPRHDVFLARAFPILEAFWSKVQRKEAPPADGLPGTSAAVRRLYADEDGETVTLDAAALELAEELEAHRLLRDAEAEQVEALENRLRARLGSASFGTLPDGSLITLRTVKRAAYTVKEGSYRQMKRITPRLRSRQR